MEIIYNIIKPGKLLIGKEDYPILQNLFYLVKINLHLLA